MVVASSRVASPGEAVVLDGSASTDPDGDDLSFAWVQREGGPRVTLSGEATDRATFTVPEGSEGTQLTFQLRVGDGRAYVSDTVQVLVVAKPESPLVAPAGPAAATNPQVDPSEAGEASASAGWATSAAIVGICLSLMTIGAGAYFIVARRKARRPDGK